MSLLIGLIDQAVTDSDKVSWSDSKIGGQPVPIWMSSTRSPAIQKCPGCRTDMTLVVQLYCPLSNSAYHRCLYVFVCASAGCHHYNSWNVYRGMQYDEVYAPTKTQKETNSKLFDDDMWADDQDDWGDDDDDWGSTGSNDNNILGKPSRDTDGGSTVLKHKDPIFESQTSKLSENLNQSNASTVVNEVNTSQIVQRDGDDIQTCSPTSDQRDMSYPSPSHSATDEDLSACFSTMDVEETQNKAGAGGDAVMEDMNIPDTGRLDQLASVLNTKYKDCASFETNQPSSTRDPIQLKPYYLSVVEDTSHQSSYASEDSHIASLILNYEQVEGKQIKEIVSERPQSKGKGGSETYEKSNVKHGDKVFHKFWKEIRKFPEQCIRYDRCGQPLLVQSLSPLQLVIPPCSNCGSPRIFELQLVPALIPWLYSVEGKPSNIEFGTILIYTCDKNCCPSSKDGLDLLEEHVICQHDPDHHLYR